MVHDLANNLSKYVKHSQQTLYVCEIVTPLGRIICAADDESLYIVSFEDVQYLNKFDAVYNELKCDFVIKKNAILEIFETEILSYFDGKLKNFTVPIKTIGTEHIKEIWEKLQEVPYGSTETYGELAKASGRPTSHARYIGAACRLNKHVIVVPCHRIVASNPNNGGYTGGIDKKTWLLQHENKFTNTF